MLQRAAPPRPSLADMVAAAWSRCIANWRPLLAISLIGAVVLGALSYGTVTSIPTDIDTSDPAQQRELLLQTTPFLVGQLLVAIFVQLALITANLAILRGLLPAFNPSLSLAVRRFPVALAASALAFIAALGLGVTLILSPVAVYLAVGWAMVYPIIIDEHPGPLRALSLSRRLVRGSWWRALGVLVSFFLLSFLAGIVIRTLCGSFAGSEVAAGLGDGVTSLFTAPFSAMGLTILYEDLRAAAASSPRPLPPPERTDV